jgi:hypothetical protein
MSQISDAWETYCQLVAQSGQLTEEQKAKIEQIKDRYIARLPSFRPELRNPKVMMMNYEARHGFKCADCLQYQVCDNDTNGHKSEKNVWIDVETDPCQCQPEMELVAGVLDIVMPDWDLINESTGLVYFFFETKELLFHHLTMATFDMNL